MMKKLLTTLLFMLAALPVSAQVVFPNRGGTGTGSLPTFGQVLVGNSGGTYTPTATSSLGITAGSVSGGTQGLLTSWLTGNTLTATNTPTFANFTSTSTATSTLKGAISISVPTGASESFETFRNGEANPRSYMDGFGTLWLGGLGSAPVPLKLGKDPFNQQFLNFTNIAGPASIFIADSNTANSGGPNSESTFTGRVVLGATGGSEWVDWFHNYYYTNGDINYGILMQKISPGQYEPFIQAYTDNAASDPSGQIKNANWFSVIKPYIPTGTTGGQSIAGTGSVSTANPTLTGSGTNFGTDLQVGDSFAIGTMYATVASVQSPTSLTMAATSTINGSGLTINRFNRQLGEMGIRVTHRDPSAFVEIGGGVGGATASSSSLKIDNATALLTNPEAGAIENFGGNLYYSPGTSVRKSFVMNNYGVSGGQTIVGGNGPGDNLLLQSTSDGTRGEIILGGTALSAYDEVNTRLGINTTNPQATLDVQGTASTTNLNIVSVTGTQCLHAVNGSVSGTGSDCGSGSGGGTSNSKWATSSDTTSIYPNTATKVGIGTSSPYTILNVNGTSAAFNSNTAMFSISASSDTNKRLNFGYDINLGINGSGYIQSVKAGSAFTPLILNGAGGNVGIGTTTAIANFQVTTSSANATTSVQLGKANQTKGTCITQYDTAGSPVYIYIAAGATSYTFQNGGTAPSGCQN